MPTFNLKTFQKERGLIPFARIRGSWKPIPQSKRNAHLSRVFSLLLSYGVIEIWSISATRKFKAKRYIYMLIFVFLIHLSVFGLHKVNFYFGLSQFALANSPLKRGISFVDFSQGEQLTT